MTSPVGQPTGSAQAGPDVKWYGLTPTEVASRLEVDPAEG